MRILILRSKRDASPTAPKDEYIQTFTTAYAERVIGNLLGGASFCTACGAECAACRRPYGRRFGESVAGVIDLPAALPYLLEDPGRYVPSRVPPHDILLAINVHEQVLLEFVKRCGEWGTRGLVAPIEAGDWVGGSTREQAEALCAEAGIEVSFPKPFCAFDPPADSVLAEFRRTFCIGKPSVELTVRDGAIERAHVDVSAACGATYYIVRPLVGKRVDEDLTYEIIAKRFSSYPCTASMAWDDELDDTIMHVAGEAHFEVLAPLRPAAESKAAVPLMIESPTGRMIQAPPSDRENVRSIERAQEAILAAVEAGGQAVSIEAVRAAANVSPAAFSSAVLLLKQQGRIRTEAGRIVRA